MGKNYGADRFYEDAFTEEYEDTPEERIEATLRSSDISHYRMKTIKSGNVLECETYPVWNTRNGQRARKAKESRQAQKNLNDKNAKKRLIRLLNANFTEEDIWATFTYDKKHLPETPQQAQREMQNYIRRLSYYNKKHGGEPLKFIYVTEYEDDPEKGKKRVHHHIVTNFRDRDIAEKMWHGGARTQARRLQPDEYGLEGLARYISKDPRGTKRYVCSKNLTQPTITVADRKITRKKARTIVENQGDAAAIFGSIYKGYCFNDIKAYFSEYASGAYIYVRMWKPPQRRNNNAKRT